MNTASASATGAVEIGGESQPPGLHIGGHQRIQPGLEDRDFAAPQGCDLAGVLVDAGDLVAEIGKAGAGNQPHIARANHGNAHENQSVSMVNADPDFAGVLEHFAAKGKPEKRGKPACLCMNKGE